MTWLSSKRAPGSHAALIDDYRVINADAAREMMTRESWFDAPGHRDARNDDKGVMVRRASAPGRAK
jgi:hypothetical protein